jgi:predicted unusual protein kinase regulating ubiquinone biosynthesis (AarF/ABC1/UbiB family)
MSLSLSPAHLRRYRDVVGLLVKYGRGDLVSDSPIVDDPLPRTSAPPTPPKADELAADLERLGPTFIKLGQLISTRADLIPASYLEALARLQDNVEPFPFDQVESIVAVEIGARISKAFLEFEAKPLAAASLGQVHRAVLRSGESVVVKVQRPGVREKVAEDLDALAEIAGVLDAHTAAGKRFEFSKIVEELRKSLLRELDYRQESANLHLMREKLGQFERLVIPRPIDDYSTGRVLTMEQVSGKKITKLSPIARLDVDGPARAEELFRAYLHQILVLGVFHADPHPGNVFLTDDHRIALLDLGMVARVGPAMQEHLLKLLLAIADGHSDRAADVAAKMGHPRDEYDEVQFHRRIAELVAQQQDATVGMMQVGRVVLEVTQLSVDCGLAVPSELTMLGKTLLNLDLVGRTLDPHFDPNDSIRRNGATILRQRTWQSLSPTNLLGALLETKELVERLPGRLNQLLELVATNKLRVKVDTIDPDFLMSGLQKIANRIALGLILASLIVGAAMLMRIETTFRIFGYPGFAILFFVAASAGGLALVVQILRSDRPAK